MQAMHKPGKPTEAVKQRVLYLLAVSANILDGCTKIK